MANSLKHLTVYREDGVFAGWPANHGKWQWGDEFLFGFMRGPYSSAGMHRISQPYEKVLARSLDGGDSWSIEKPNVDFNASMVIDKFPVFSLLDTIVRMCGVYDTGGEECVHTGGFYLSRDRGKYWHGPYSFPNDINATIEQHNLWNTSRTAYIERWNILFVSLAQRYTFGTDKVFCLRVEGDKLKAISSMCNDEHRTVMPSVVLNNNGVFAACRRRNSDGECWIDIFYSRELKNWEIRSRVSNTGKDNGNPPALLDFDGSLLCAYANRSEKRICLSVSQDNGFTWKENVLRDSGKSDIGYPILFRRNDGKFVCIYYWADANIPNEQRIESTTFDPRDYL